MRKKYKQAPVLSHSSLREAKQVPVWVTPVCAKLNRRLFESLQSARSQTGACLGHSSLRESKRAPVWGRLRPPAKFGRVLDKSPLFLVSGKLPCLGRGWPPAKFGRVQDKSPLFLVSGKLPCLGRGLREGKQVPVYLHPTFPITTRFATSCSTLSA